MAALGIQGNGDGGSHISEEAIKNTLESLENQLQKVIYATVGVVKLCCLLYPH